MCLDNNRMEAVPVQLPNLEVYVLFLLVCFLLYLPSLYTNRLNLSDNQITAVPSWLSKMTGLIV